jgi:hypothetical protein
MKFRARALGLAIGVVWGGAVFFITIMASVMGKGHTLSFLAAYYLGYTVSIEGAFIGLIWGFLDGLIFGALVASLYNIFQKLLYKSDTGGM